MMMDITTIYYVKNKDTHRYTYYTKDCAPASARHLSYHTGKTVKVHQPDGTVATAYMYGEKTYSYNAQEVAEYREVQKAKREHEARRKAMLTAIMARYEVTDTEMLAVTVAQM